MARQGLCSRREADRYIEQGLVYVDGEPITQLGSRILPTQKIRLDKKAKHHQRRLLTLILNKPVGYVSGQPEKEYSAAVTLIKPENLHWPDPKKRRPRIGSLKGLAPAGRLDIDSHGLLVLTQDGRIARQLIGPESTLEKEYLVRVEGKITDHALTLLRQGLTLDGRVLKKAKVRRAGEGQLRFCLIEGRKRQIRRMCDQVNLKVTGLRRIRIGQIQLGRLPRGRWRPLNPGEHF